MGIDQFDERIVLDGTDSSSTNVGDNILFETATGDTGTGVLKSESAKGIGGKVKEHLYTLERLRLITIQCQELKIIYYYILQPIHLEIRVVSY